MFRCCCHYKLHLCYNFAINTSTSEVVKHLAGAITLLNFIQGAETYGSS